MPENLEETKREEISPMEVVSVSQEDPDKKRRETIALNKAECLQYLQDFYSRSFAWRQATYHERWERYNRNYHSVYDPTKKKEKAAWQSTMFVPTTVTNVEVISSAIAKVLLGRARPIIIEKREMGDILQADLMTKLIDYEIDKSNFRISFYDALKQACIYGSGFVKFYWKKQYSKRRVKEPVMESPWKAMLRGRTPGVEGYEENEREVLVADHAVSECVDIFDIFKEPNSTTMEKVIQRGQLSYAEILDNVKEGFDEEAVRMLKGEPDESRIPDDKTQKEVSDKGKSDDIAPKTIYQKRHTVWEWWGPLPKRWVYFETDPTDPTAEELIPAHSMVAAKKYLLFSEANTFEVESVPIEQIDYIRTGDSYGKGVCELLEGIQEEINEIRNQRIDNVSLIMNKMIAVIEKYLVDPKDLVSQPGGTVRLKGTDDVRKAFAWQDTPDVARSAFAETLELERSAQEVTAANRMTLGTAGMQKDVNQTLGGMQLLQSAAYERFSLYAFMIERGFLIKAGKWFYSLIYQNRDQDSIRRILGEQPIPVLGPMGMPIPMPKWMLFQWLPSHEVESDYDFKTVGTFTMGDKERKAIQLMQFAQTFGPLLIGFDPRPIAKRVAQLQEIDEDIGEMLANAQPVNPELLGLAAKHGGQQKGDLARPSQASPDVGGEASRVIPRGG